VPCCLWDRKTKCLRTYVAPRVVLTSFRVGGTQNQAANPSFRVPSYLTGKRTNTESPRTRFIELAGEINTRMPEHVVHRVADALNSQQNPLMVQEFSCLAWLTSQMLMMNTNRRVTS